MTRPVVSDLAELLHESLGFHAEDDATMGLRAPAHTNLRTNPSGELVVPLTGGSSYTVTRVLASAEGVDAFAGEYVAKSVCTGSADSNVGFFAFTFPAAGVYTLSIYCLLPSNWDGGAVQWNAEGYTGSSEVDVLKAEPTARGAWQRVVCQVTAVAGDLAGNLVLRAAPGFPTVGRALYFDACQVETGAEATTYADGNSPRSVWNGAPHESTSTFLGFDETWPLLRFCAAWVSPIDSVYDLVREGEDGAAPWGILFDVNECPAEHLPYLAQYPGCVLTPEMTEEQIRDEIRRPTGWRRGQEASIAVATQRTLTGTMWVSIRPNKPSVGKTYVRTLLAETVSPTRTEAVVRAAVPAWSVLDYEALAGVTWTDIEVSSKFETFEALEKAFADFDALEHILSSEL